MASRDERPQSHPLPVRKPGSLFPLAFTRNSTSRPAPGLLLPWVRSNRPSGPKPPGAGRPRVPVA